MEVTTTTTKAGKFDTRFYHDDHKGRWPGAFVPIRNFYIYLVYKYFFCFCYRHISFSYSSGGENGYVRVHLTRVTLNLNPVCMLKLVKVNYGRVTRERTQYAFYYACANVFWTVSTKS